MTTKEYYQQNKTRILKYGKKYYYKNRTQRLKYAKEYTRKHKKSHKRAQKRWYLNHPDWYRKRILKKYKLTLDNYNQLLNKQNKCCAICGKHQLKLTKHLFVDHDHKTGKIRGLLCCSCNFGLGCFFHNISILKKAINYLKK